MNETDEYIEWEKEVFDCIKGDSVWKIKAYRLAMFVADKGWTDVTKLSLDQRTIALSNQLYRALGSISANLAEGYSRCSAKDRARMYEYALGSARESRDWYYKGRHVLGSGLVAQRISTLTDIIRLVTTMIPDQRGESMIKEDGIDYVVASDAEYE